MDVELRNQQCNLSQNPKIPRNIIPISLMVLIGVSTRRWINWKEKFQFCSEHSEVVTQRYPYLEPVHLKLPDVRAIILLHIIEVGGVSW